MSNYLVGTDAIDLARITDLPLHRMPCRVDDAPDTSWSVADTLIAEGATPDEFFFDLDRLSNTHASHIILSLVGFIKAWHDYCIPKELCSSLDTLPCSSSSCSSKLLCEGLHD